MTGREIQKEFEIAASIHNSLKDISIKGNIINYFMNEYQNIFINKRLKNIRERIEGSQKDIDELRSIIARDTTLTLSSSTTSYEIYTLPSNYLYLLNDRTTTSFCSNVKEYSNRLSKLEDIHTLLNYKYTSTKYDSPVSALSGNNLYIYKDSTFTINNVKIDYVTTYTEIDVIGNVTSDLDSNVHKELIQGAVNIFLENVESGRFKTNIDKNILTQQLK